MTARRGTLIWPHASCAVSYSILKELSKTAQSPMFLGAQTCDLSAKPTGTDHAEYRNPARQQVCVGGGSTHPGSKRWKPVILTWRTAYRKYAVSH
jgi:hypothetical protein